MREEKDLVHSDLTRKIIQCCFEVMKELGAGFLENVYKNALYLAMKQKGIDVQAEQKYEVRFMGHKIGKYVGDLVADNLVIVELKCCKALPAEHQAQVINYLKASGLPVGLYRNNLKNRFLTAPASSSLQPPASAMVLPWPASAPLRCCKPEAPTLSNSRFFRLFRYTGQFWKSEIGI